MTKNSSLAALIAYPDLVLVFAGTALMQTGRAIEILMIVMFTYLSISVFISMIMNWYNKKLLYLKNDKIIKSFKTNKENLYINLCFGIILLFLSITDFILKYILSLNFTNFLPNILNLFFPLILGTIAFT